MMFSMAVRSGSVGVTALRSASGATGGATVSAAAGFAVSAPTTVVFSGLAADAAPSDDEFFLP